MAFQVIKMDGSYSEDIVLDTNDISESSLFADPEFILFCIEADIDENTTLDDVITQFNSK